MSVLSNTQPGIAQTTNRTTSNGYIPSRTRAPSARNAAARQRRTNGGSSILTAGSDTSQFDGYQADERESDQIRPESSASQITSLSGHTVRRVDHRRHFEETSQIDEELEAADGGSTLRTHIEPSLDGSDLSREKSSPVEVIAPVAELADPRSAPLSSRVARGAPVVYPPLQEEIRDLNHAGQELCLIDDLLYVLLGMEGDYIRYRQPFDPSNEVDALRGPHFVAPRETDPSIRDLAESIAEIGSHYAALEAFLELTGKGDLGSVYHALCAAMRVHVKDYLILVAQLENQAATNPEFTLHQFNLLILPTSRIVLQMYSLAQEILHRNALLGQADDEDDGSQDESDDMELILDALREGQTTGLGASRKTCKGGALLRLLSDKLMTTIGDLSIHRLLESLLEESSRPFVEMLNGWLHRGEIQDPHNEFMIQERRSITKERIDVDYTDEYWDKRYTIREQDVPSQLFCVKDKVLLAGKYLNVVRECGKTPSAQIDEDETPQTILDDNFVPNVNLAYAEANRHLLHLLLSTHNLLDRFKSLKHYFFLDRSDFLSNWIENAEGDFKKPWNQISIEKLQNIFDLVINSPGSVASLDPYKDDIKISLNKTPFTKWLMHINNIQGFDPETASLFETPAASSKANSVPATDEKPISGYEALELNYTVPFPLSLVISRKIIVRYQMIFRFLFSLRYLEAQLGASWKEHNDASTVRHHSKIPQIESIKRRSWALRSRMLIFVQQLLYYATEEVIEPAWQALMMRIGSEADVALATGSDEQEEKRAGVGTVDQLMVEHLDFLDTCIKGCMLTNHKLLRLYEKLTNASRLFAENYTPMQSRYILRSDPELVAKHNAIESGGSEKPIKHDPDAVGKLSENLGKYEDNFTRHLRILLDALNHFAATETNASMFARVIITPGLQPQCRTSDVMQRVMWARPDEQTAYGTQVTVRTEQRVERATKAELSRTATTKRFLGFCETHFAARKSLGPSNGGYGKMMANQVEGASQAPDNGIRLGETASWPMVLSSGFV